MSATSTRKQRGGTERGRSSPGVKLYLTAYNLVQAVGWCEQHARSMVWIQISMILNRVRRYYVFGRTAGHLLTGGHEQTWQLVAAVVGTPTLHTSTLPPIAFVLLNLFV